MSLLGILFIVLLARAHASTCPSASYVDTATLPNAPVYPTQTLDAALTPSPSASNPLTQGHWSETANLAAYRPPAVILSSNPAQTNCPHKQSGLKNWHDPATWGGNGIPTNGSSFSIPSNTQVLIASCSIDPTYVFGTITVPVNSSLIFGDANIVVSATGFNVMGSLLAGSQTCRLRNKITITLYGKRDAQPLPADEWVKGISVPGTIDLHGALYSPTWSRLAMTANINATWIFIQDIVNWQPGQRIVITTTEMKDSRDWHRNEERTIVAVKLTTLGANVSAIQIDSPLSYQHFGGTEYQAEVALLSRNIVVQGDAFNSDPTDNQQVACNVTTDGSTFPCVDSFLTGFGAHIIVRGPTAQGRFSGVEMFRVGQTNTLGRYPIHFHMMGNQSSYNYQSAFVQDCAVHQSYFRCYAIHGTQGALLTRNTAYNAIGHCYFLEDGVEEDNIISYNQASHVHPLGPIQNPSLNLNGDSWGSQYLSNYNQSATLLLPSDMSAGCFYITNTYNDFYGNAASGGWAGFAIPGLLYPVKLSINVTNMSPANRPFRTPFRGNSAHSSGHWWATAGAIYVGGQLSQPNATSMYSSTGTLMYNAGRSLTRNTCANKNSATGCSRNDYLWLRFEDNKVFLANRGMQHWGTRAEIIRFELHDVSLSMNVFGQVWIDQMLMECRSINHQPTFFNGCPKGPATFTKSPPYGKCNVRDYNFWSGFGGFQWYDVGQNHILTNTTFRNCRNDWTYCVYGSGGNCSSVAVFTSLTHSDQFVPELMQVTSGIQYQNVTALWRYSTALSYAGGITVSGRLQNWYDYDGTASGVGSRAVIGSARANDWWKYNDNCGMYIEAWTCKLATNDSMASVIIHYNSTIENGIGTTYCVNGNSDGTKKCPVIGAVSHFGSKNESAGLMLAENPKVSGPIIYSSGGWFVRFTAGTPKVVTFGNIEIYADSIFLVGIPYPRGTTFNITYVAPSWCNSAYSVCQHPYRQVNSVSEVESAFGDAYYWSDSQRVLYLRIVYAAESFGSKGTVQQPWSPFPMFLNFSRGGRTLPLPGYTSVKIVASCASDTCDPQPDVPVPNALHPIVSGTTAAVTTAAVTTAAATSATSSSTTTTSSKPTTNPGSSSTSTSATTTATTTTTKATTAATSVTSASTTTTKATTVATAATTTTTAKATTATTSVTSASATTTKPTTASTVATSVNSAATTTKPTSTSAASSTATSTSASKATTIAATSASATSTSASSTTTKSTTTSSSSGQSSITVSTNTTLSGTPGGVNIPQFNSAIESGLSHPPSSTTTTLLGNVKRVDTTFTLETVVVYNNTSGFDASVTGQSLLAEVLASINATVKAESLTLVNVEGKYTTASVTPKPTTSFMGTATDTSTTEEAAIESSHSVQIVATFFLHYVVFMVFLLF